MDGVDHLEIVRQLATRRLYRRPHGLGADRQLAVVVASIVAVGVVAGLSVHGGGGRAAVGRPPDRLLDLERRRRVGDDRRDRGARIDGIPGDGSTDNRATTVPSSVPSSVPTSVPSSHCRTADL